MTQVTSIRNIKVGLDAFEARATDPYGFWTVKMLGKGGTKTPPELLSNFTSLTEVEKAIKAVCAKKHNKDPSDLRVETENPMGDKDLVVDKE